MQPAVVQTGADTVCRVISLADDDILAIGAIVIEAYRTRDTDDDQHII